MSATRMERITNALLRAMKSDEISPNGADLYQLASDLLICAYPEAPPPDKLDSFSLLVGFAAGSTLEKYEKERG